MVYTPKRSINLGRDCADFKRCTREEILPIPAVGQFDESDSAFKEPSIDMDERRRGGTASPAAPRKRIIVDCMMRETCADRINFRIPGEAHRKGAFGDCIGIKFTKDDIKLLRKGLADIVDE